MKVTVFGGSQPKADSRAYAEAQSLGEMLAQRGHTVLTGGYMGTMEAVSRGAAGARGHVIGVTCDELSRWHGLSVNRWVTEEWKRSTLIERLQTLIENADAALALPGGPGTLTEIALTWNLMIVGSMKPRPLVLVGDAWQQVLRSFYSHLNDYTPGSQRELLRFAATPEEAVEMLDSTQL
jgi:hypothetical protein